MANSSSSTKETKEKKKRGNRGDFHGQRLEFLEANLPNYQRVSKEGKVRPWFNDVLFPEYWAKFHWSLPLEKEPSPSDVYPGNDSLTKAEEETKETTMKAMGAKIRSWFNYRRNLLGLNTSKDPWGPWLAQLHKPLDGPPRLAHDYQFYMRHPEFKAKVTDTFNAECAREVRPQGDLIAFRCEVSKGLLAAEPPAVKQRLLDEAKEAHRVAMERYEQGVHVADCEDPEQRAEAIASLSTVVQPLLDGLRAHTGMYFQLMAATPSTDNSSAQCVFLGAGKSENGLDFSGLDPVGFQAFTKLFLRWTMVASGALPISSLSGGVHFPSAPTPMNPIVPAVTQSLHDDRNPVAQVSTRVGATHGSPGVTNQPSNPAGRATGSTVSTVEERAARATERLERAKEATRLLLLDAGLEVSPPLLLQIAQMTPSDKAARIASLRRMSSFEVEREENIARNAELLAALGVDSGAVAALFADPKRGTLPTADENEGDNDDYRPEKGAGPSKPVSKQGEMRRSSRLLTQTNGSDGLQERDEGLPQGEEGMVGEEEATTDAGTQNPTSKQTGSVRRSSRHSTKTNTAEDPQVGANICERPPQSEVAVTRKKRTADSAVEAPKWYTEGAAKFSEVDRSVYGDQWFVLVNLWKGQEERYGYLSNGPEMSKLHRPPQVGTWVKSARFFHRIPNIPDPIEFAEQWWAWWRAANPSWRVSDDSDALLKEGGGTLDGVAPPGPNGIVGAITALWWWRAVTPDSSIAINDWQEAVDDVSWVLGRLAEDDEGEPTEEQPTKR
ncbi:hypothetical protein PLEOSDRAFT_1102316 [Pleurotus ostreatus PC15]|uniref:Uncharacterized protein n=1 Tax=Pleurotus ostreatus (strain PC15) TaxID=1137138 RepID=A0A067P652_PLEO1|nr:hypothetical protein PLEOSDRAFT_1102316 [Pleurotus ostreatus PC15]